MTSECILTKEVAYCNGIEVGVMLCPICLKESEAKGGYLGILQTGCGHEWHEEMWMGSIAYKRREYLGLSRREMSELSGYSIHSIKKYELSRCSKKYFEVTEKLVKGENERERS